MAFFISNYVCANWVIKTQPVYTLLLYNKKVLKSIKSNLLAMYTLFNHTQLPLSILKELTMEVKTKFIYWISQ